MQNRSIFIAILVALVIISSCKKEDIVSSNLQIICEEFRPYSYSENNTLKGISVDIVDSILGCLGITDKSIEVTSNWDEAYELLETSDNVVLFTTVMTSERKNKFKWVGPVMLSSMSIIGKQTNDHIITSINEAKALNSIGVVSGYPTVGILEDGGFTNQIYFNTANEAVAALFDGSIEAIFDLAEGIKAIADANGFNSGQLKNLYTYSTAQGFLAFSPGVPSETISLWQEKLDWLKTEGYVQKVHDKYLSGTIVPNLLTIYTEENPPQSYGDGNGNITGSSVEIVEAIMKEIDSNDPIIINNWTQGYNQALLVPNSVIFSTMRTEARESLFNWIGPLCKKSYCFFVKASGSIHLNELDDAKSLGAIGVPDGWASENELIEAGFSNIQSGLTPSIVFEMLMDGTVDAAVLNDIAIESLATELGYSASDVRNELVLSTGETYIAFNIETKSEYFQEWQNAFNTIVENGTYDEIWTKWYPDIEPPR